MSDRLTIRALAIVAADACDDPNPRAVADALIAALPKARYEEALRESLWLYIRNLAHTGSLNGAAIEHGRSHLEATRGVGRMGAARSLAWLRQRVSVSPGVYKFLGDCTADDLGVMADVRREHAKANAEAADRYERLAHLMRDAKAKKLADLPPDVLAAES